MGKEQEINQLIQWISNVHRKKIDFLQYPKYDYTLNIFKSLPSSYFNFPEEKLLTFDEWNNQYKDCCYENSIYNQIRIGFKLLHLYSNLNQFHKDNYKSIIEKYLVNYAINYMIDYHLFLMLEKILRINGLAHQYLLLSDKKKQCEEWFLKIKEPGEKLDIIETLQNFGKLGIYVSEGQYLDNVRGLYKKYISSYHSKNIDYVLNNRCTIETLEHIKSLIQPNHVLWKPFSLEVLKIKEHVQNAQQFLSKDIISIKNMCLKDKISLPTISDISCVHLVSSILFKYEGIYLKDGELDACLIDYGLCISTHAQILELLKKIFSFFAMKWDKTFDSFDGIKFRSEKNSLQVDVPISKDMEMKETYAVFMMNGKIVIDYLPDKFRNLIRQANNPINLILYKIPTTIEEFIETENNVMDDQIHACNKMLNDIFKACEKISFIQDCREGKLVAIIQSYLKHIKQIIDKYRTGKDRYYHEFEKWLRTTFTQKQEIIQMSPSRMKKSKPYALSSTLVTKPKSHLHQREVGKHETKLWLNKEIILKAENICKLHFQKAEVEEEKANKWSIEIVRNLKEKYSNLKEFNSHFRSLTAECNVTKWIPNLMNKIYTIDEICNMETIHLHPEKQEEREKSYKDVKKHTISEITRPTAKISKHGICSIEREEDTFQMSLKQSASVSSSSSLIQSSMEKEDGNKAESKSMNEQKDINMMIKVYPSEPAYAWSLDYNNLFPHFQVLVSNLLVKSHDIYRRLRKLEKDRFLDQTKDSFIEEGLLAFTQCFKKENENFIVLSINNIISTSVHIGTDKEASCKACIEKMIDVLEGVLVNGRNILSYYNEYLKKKETKGPFKGKICSDAFAKLLHSNKILNIESENDGYHIGSVGETKILQMKDMSALVKKMEKMVDLWHQQSIATTTEHHHLLPSSSFISSSSFSSLQQRNAETKSSPGFTNSISMDLDSKNEEKSFPLKGKKRKLFSNPSPHKKKKSVENKSIQKKNLNHPLPQHHPISRKTPLYHQQDPRRRRKSGVGFGDAAIPKKETKIIHSNDQQLKNPPFDHHSSHGNHVDYNQDIESVYHPDDYKRYHFENGSHYQDDLHENNYPESDDEKLFLVKQPIVDVVNTVTKKLVAKPIVTGDQDTIYRKNSVHAEKIDSKPNSVDDQLHIKLKKKARQRVAKSVEMAKESIRRFKNQYSVEEIE